MEESSEGGSVHMGSELAGLHMTVMLKGESFRISRNWLGLGGTVPPGSVRTQMSNIRKYRK